MGEVESLGGWSLLFAAQSFSRDKSSENVYMLHCFSCVTMKHKQYNMEYCSGYKYKNFFPETWRMVVWSRESPKHEHRYDFDWNKKGTRIGLTPRRRYLAVTRQKILSKKLKHLIIIPLVRFINSKVKGNDIVGARQSTLYVALSTLEVTSSREMYFIQATFRD